MSSENARKRPWRETMRVWLHPKVITMFFLGLSAGVPILLIFSTLSVWLLEAGVDRAAVTFFSWAALGYSFKFIWAPLVDLVPLPFLTAILGRRRAWLLVAQLSTMTAICWMASIDPASQAGNLTLMALAAVFLGFSSATQDIVIDAYRIESCEKEMQAMLAATYIAGYRIGMLVAGAGSLFLASGLGTQAGAYNYQAWCLTYLAMAAVMGIGVVTTFLIKEPEVVAGRRIYTYSPAQYGRFFIFFLSAAICFACTFFFGGQVVERALVEILAQYVLAGKVLAFAAEALRFAVALAVAGLAAWTTVKLGWVDRQMVEDTYLAPVRDFFKRYGMRAALIILALIGFYRLSDIVMGVVANVFYLDMGFSKNAIAGISKSFGLVMTLLGGFLGGMLTVRYGVMRILFVGATLSAVTNLLFMLLAGQGDNLTLLTLVISADNLSAGLATTAFVAFLSALTNISFTAVQYALFSSGTILLPKLIGGYAGSMVSAMGYNNFFLVTALMGLPVLVLVWLNKDVVGGQ